MRDIYFFLCLVCFNHLFCYMYIYISHVNFFFFGSCTYFSFLVRLKSCLNLQAEISTKDQFTIFLLSIQDSVIQVHTEDSTIFTGLSLWFCLFQLFWKCFLIERESKYYSVEKDHVTLSKLNSDDWPVFPNRSRGRK